MLLPYPLRVRLLAALGWLLHLDKQCPIEAVTFEQYKVSDTGQQSLRLIPCAKSWAALSCVWYCEEVVSHCRVCGAKPTDTSALNLMFLFSWLAPLALYTSLAVLINVHPYAHLYYIRTHPYKVCRKCSPQRSQSSCRP